MCTGAQVCSESNQESDRLCLCCIAGFNNIEPLIGYDNNVLNKYFNEYLPQAVSEQLTMCCMTDVAYI